MIEPRSLLDMSGRRVMITGGAGKLGRVIGEGLARLGATVYAVDIDEEALSHLPADSGPGEMVPICWDLSKLDELADLRRAVVERAGKLDVLINNAAYIDASGLSGWTTEFASQGIEAWTQCLNLNLSVPFRLSQEFAETLAAGRGGTILNVSSIHGVVGPDWRLYEGTSMGNPAAYGVSKGGLIQLTRWLATVLAPRVRVNSLSAGGIDRGQPESFQKRYGERTPLQRMATEDDFVGAVTFLASDMSSYVTGQNLIVDGGYTVW